MPSKIDANALLKAGGDVALQNALETLLEGSEGEFEAMKKTSTNKKENSNDCGAKLALLGESGADYLNSQYLHYLDTKEQFADRKTGFSNLDDEIGGLLPGVYVVGGLSALGKTTFVLQLMTQLSLNGEYCFFCSYEMAKGELFSKILAREVYRIESNNFTSRPEKVLTAANITKKKFYKHRDNFNTALNSLAQTLTNFRVWEIEDSEFNNLLNRLERICAILDKPPVVCIDYLQLLAAGSDNVKNVLDGILFKLKSFQRKTNTTFFIVSSLNRANYQTEISFESFKESGSIEYSADAIWGLQLLLDKRTAENAEKAKKEIPRQIQLKCLKNRFGANFDIGFFYFPNADLFLPMEEYGEYTDYHTNDSGALAKGATHNGKPKF